MDHLARVLLKLSVRRTLVRFTVRIERAHRSFWCRRAHLDTTTTGETRRARSDAPYPRARQGRARRSARAARTIIAEKRTKLVVLPRCTRGWSFGHLDLVIHCSFASIQVG